jgi:hypothetical protein
MSMGRVIMGRVVMGRDVHGAGCNGDLSGLLEKMCGFRARLVSGPLVVLIASFTALLL